MESFCGCTENIGEFGSKWGIKTLTWHVANYVHKIRDYQNALMNEMFHDLMSRVCDLTFEYTQNPAQANLIYSVGRGNRARFDGPRGTLAYAFLPPNSNFRGQLGVYFDLDEIWSPKKPTHSLSHDEGIRFFNVCYHETLHALGLDHTSVPRQLMNPTYAPNIAIAQDDDVSRLQALYGAPKPTTTTPSSAEKAKDRIEVLINGIVKKGIITWD